LLAQEIGAANTFLPGGHVEPGEGLTDSLAREIDEELGLWCRVGAYLGTVEAQWPDPDPKHYEVNHLFLVELAEPGVALASREAHLRFFWCPVGELGAHNLLPAPLRELIAGYVTGERRVWWGSVLPRKGVAEEGAG